MEEKIEHREDNVIKIKQNKLVVKHNKLIEFKGRMSVNEIKLFGLIISDLREMQKEQFKEYYIDVSILKETTKHKDFYNHIKSTALSLENKRLVVESINESSKRETTLIRLINKPRIVEDSKHLELYIDKDLLPYVLDLKRNFTRYQIENILRLKSGHSVRVYELLKQYEKIGKRSISIEELREYLGIEEQEYERFYDFEKWVLKVAKREINKHTDINIDYEKIKEGRRIVTINFKIESKVSNEFGEYLESTYDIKKFKIGMGLEEENFNSQQIIEIYEKAVEKNPEFIEKEIFKYVKINYLYMIEKGTAKNKFTYLMKGLDNDYANASVLMKYSVV